MEIRSIHTIGTAENISLTVELAGVGNRIYAFLIDFLLMGCLMGLVMVFSSMLYPLSGELSRTVQPLLLFAVFFGFHFFQEWLWSGKTVGKYLLNIRVVRNNGQPIGFWEAFGRNLLRVVDVYLSGIGFISMLISGSEKRLGDFLCGTLVVSDQPVVKHPTPREPATSTASPAPALFTLSSEEIELLKTYLGRSPGLLPEARKALEVELRQYFKARLQCGEAEAEAADFLPNLLASIPQG